MYVASSDIWHHNVLFSSRRAIFSHAQSQTSDITILVRLELIPLEYTGYLHIDIVASSSVLGCHAENWNPEYLTGSILRIMD